MTSSEYKQAVLNGVNEDPLLAIIVLVLSVAANGFATAAIAYRAWKVILFCAELLTDLYAGHFLDPSK
jgi:hypothetical protein